jgi:serralysin
MAINRNTYEAQVRPVVLHEFGHVLGCIHEHSSPAAQIPWNKDTVYEQYHNNGLDRATFDRNILRPKDNVTHFSHFDPQVHHDLPH